MAFLKRGKKGKNEDADLQPSSSSSVRVTIKSKRTLKGHFGKITALHWSGDSRRVVSAAQDGYILVWNAFTAHKLNSISLRSSFVMSVGIEQSENGGNLVACGGLDNLCTIYRLSDLSSAASNTSPDYGAEPSRPAMELVAHDGFISCCRFRSESSILTSSGDSTCLLWDIAGGGEGGGGRVVETFAEHTADVMFMALKPDDSQNIFASVSVDKTCKIWDVRVGGAKSVQSFENHLSDVNCVDFMSSDPNMLATCSDDRSVQILDLRSDANPIKTLGKPVGPSPDAAYDLDQQQSGFCSVACSKSGQLVYAGHTDGSLIAFDVQSGSVAHRFGSAHAGPISCVGIAPNGAAMCTGSYDKNLKVWA